MNKIGSAFDVTLKRCSKCFFWSYEFITGHSCRPLKFVTGLTSIYIISLLSIIGVKSNSKLLEATADFTSTDECWRRFRSAQPVLLPELKSFRVKHRWFLTTLNSIFLFVSSPGIIIFLLYPFFAWYPVRPRVIARTEISFVLVVLVLTRGVFSCKPEMLLYLSSVGRDIPENVKFHDDLTMAGRRETRRKRVK